MNYVVFTYEKINLNQMLNKPNSNLMSIYRVLKNQATIS
jgi:hypothetical protein